MEIDVTKSRDGVFFAFHPGMEPVFLKCGKLIPEKGWGWLADKNIDCIQTDWLLDLRCFMESRGKR